MDPTTRTESWLGRGAHVDWHGEVPAWVNAVEDWGPWIAGVVFTLLFVRALAHARRYRTTSVFGSSAEERVHDALLAAEAHTTGEIVPVVCGRSDRHSAAEWISAVVLALGTTLFFQSGLPWDRPHLVVGVQVGAGVLGFLLARHLPSWKRMFVSEKRLEEAAQARAVLEFERLRLHETTGRTGVLLFVSLFEHRVIVLADVGIHGRVGEELVWDEARESLLEGIRHGRLDDGLIAAIRRVGALLDRHAPWTSGERNEIPDRVVVRPD